MAKQTLMFVVLPNGISPGGRLRLSVFLSPRLEGSATLHGFPDFLHWTSLVKNHGLSFQLSCGAQTATVAVDRARLRGDIWDAIFPSDAFVEAYRLPAYEKRLMVSYPARDAMSFLKFAYQQVSQHPFQPDRRQYGLLNQLLFPLKFRDGKKTTLFDVLPEFRVELWRSQQDGGEPLLSFLRRQNAQAAALAAAPPDGVPTLTSLPPTARDTATRVALFHHMEPAHHRKPLPATKDEFKKTLDFHKALSAINSYPALQRSLGIVFDLEVPADFAASSPATAGGAYSTLGVTAVKPGFTWKIPPQFVLPQTAYFRSGNQFNAAPATPSADLPSHNYLPSDVIEGMLALSPLFFHLNEVDVDGAMLKALSLADNLALVEEENSKNLTHPVDVEQVLPALRSGGIALMADGRGEQLLQSIHDNRAFDDALQANAPMPRPFVARDLVRGYRLDIWSSQKNQWYSLHRRHSTYRFGEHLDRSIAVADEEGFTQLGVSSPAPDPTRKVDPVAKAAGAPQPGTDLHVHERVALWNGWSLSIQRPGGAINRSADPAKATDPDPTVEEPITPFKMVSSFAPVDRSLPKLRFGTRYRLRARTVDLAGNSVPHDHKSAPEAALPSSPLPYLRFEPVVDPVLMLREPLQTGASLERLVIRTYNSDRAGDQAPSTERDQRHVLPPRTSEKMAERHGMLDDAQGRLSGDHATYNMVTQRDAAELPHVTPNGSPMDPRPQTETPYLPDPIARGAALRDLPNTLVNTDGRIHNGKLHYQAIPPMQSPPTLAPPRSVTFIDFGLSWPDKLPFRVVLAEGNEAPKWDDNLRVLTLHLPKSEVLQVPLSSYLNPDDLSLMGIWDWLRQSLESIEASSRQFDEGPFFPTDLFGQLTGLALEGGHPMITPSRPLVLVHAVQQPLGVPEFTMLPVVHGAGPSSDPSALPNAFAPITAWRSLESHDAALLGGLHIHGKSTARIDLQGYWLEYVDDPAQPGPQKQKASAHVEKIELPTVDPGIIFSDASRQRMVGTYIPEGDVLWFSAPSDVLPGMAAPGAVAAPLHRFTDTKHRLVRYQAVATSRFREYFQHKTGLKFTRSSARVVVNIPSSARPAAPEVAYVVPVFGSQRQETTNVKTDVRFGNSLRIYLQRPWYSSGERELLGVVLWPAGTPLDTPTREQFKSFFTQWGLDPIWQSGDVSAVPSTFDFSRAVASGQRLTLAESNLLVDVAGHCVEFDSRRKLWYCDVTLLNEQAYMPFIRLALARYQPHSLPGVELSHVVLADFCQLTPDRSATVSVDPSDPRVARVFVGGVGPAAPRHNLIEVSVERRMKSVVSDLGWEPAPGDVVTVAEDAPGSASPDIILWSGTVRFAKSPAQDQYRVVVREYELLEADPPTVLRPILPPVFRRADLGRNIRVGGAGLPIQPRLVYAAIVPYNFPG